MSRTTLLIAVMVILLTTAATTIGSSVAGPGSTQATPPGLAESTSGTGCC